jgi:hypothetical protein
LLKTLKADKAFGEGDIAYVQLRGQVLEKERRKYRLDNQHCIIL